MGIKIVSACLAGINCRYDGKSKPNAKVIALVKSGKAIPVCPEQLAGLGTPRKQTEQRNGRVFTIDGEDVTEQFERGAKEALKIAKEHGCKEAILKARSPSCGVGQIYDGTFSGKLVDGNGVFAKMLKEQGVKVITEEGLK